MGRKRIVRKQILNWDMKEKLSFDKNRLLNYLRVITREQKQLYTDMKMYDYYEKERLNTLLLLVIISTGLKHEETGFTHTLESCFKMDYNTFYHKMSGFNFKANEVYNVVEYLISHNGDATAIKDIWNSFKKLEEHKNT